MQEDITIVKHDNCSTIDCERERGKERPRVCLCLIVTFGREPFANGLALQRAKPRFSQALMDTHYMRLAFGCKFTRGERERAKIALVRLVKRACSRAATFKVMPAKFTHRQPVRELRIKVHPIRQIRDSQNGVRQRWKLLSFSIPLRPALIEQLKLLP